MSYRIYLYNEIQDLDFDRAVSYLSEKCFFAEIEIRDNFISHFYSDQLIRGLAGAWQTDLVGEGALDRTFDKRLEYERRVYEEPDIISSQVVYNGWDLLGLLQSRILETESAFDTLHIYLTPRLMVTEDDMDRRYHARTIIGGQPFIISSSGLVEAPARSMEYYIFQAGYKMKGQEIPDSIMKKKFAGEFLDYHDSRLTEVMLGYLLQAVACQFFGEAFCDDPQCRLFNAHRQQEMLSAQLSLPEFCPRHQALFTLPDIEGDCK